MVRKTAIALFITLVLGGVGLGFFTILREVGTSNIKDDSIKLPLAIDNKRVFGGMIHYYISGKLEKVIQQNENYKLEFTDHGNLPEMIITKGTRVFKISPPYGPETIVDLKVTDLKQGDNLDVSIEYDPAFKKWFVRDVLYPTDKN